MQYTSALMGALVRATRRVLPIGPRRWFGALWNGQQRSPSVGRVRFGDLRRVTPIGRKWGKDRGGLPIDRYYIERFLAAHASDVRGRVLEVGDSIYTHRYGGRAVQRSDVLHLLPGNPAATIVADLAQGGPIPTAAFQCVILTQVLHVMADFQPAVHTVHRILKPGGVVLATLAGISQISRWDMERWGDYWRFTTLSARRLFESVFPPDQVQVEAYGNVLAAVAFLHGLASHELRAQELDHTDPDYQFLITVRAVKSSASPADRGPLEPSAP